MRISKGMSSPTPEGLFSGSGESVAHVVIAPWQRYGWGNNPKRATYKDRMCRVIARGKMGSVLVEFENGERTITSWKALKEVKIQ